MTACSHVAEKAAYCPRTKLLLGSTDEGESWSIRNVTAELAAAGVPGVWAPGPSTGIQLAQGRKQGRLLVCGSYRPHAK